MSKVNNTITINNIISTSVLLGYFVLLIASLPSTTGKIVIPDVTLILLLITLGVYNTYYTLTHSYKELLEQGKTKINQLLLKVSYVIYSITVMFMIFNYYSYTIIILCYWSYIIISTLWVHWKNIIPDIIVKSSN